MIFGQTLSTAETLAACFSSFSVELERRLEHEFPEGASVFFVGRDGLFLRQVFDATKKSSKFSSEFGCISRTQARLASIFSSNDIQFVCKDLSATKTFNLNGNAIVRYLGLDPNQFPVDDEPAIAIEQLCGAFFPDVVQCAISARSSLATLICPHAVFVDIGWQGTLASLLDRAAIGHESKRWFYFCRWTDHNFKARGNDCGLFSDYWGDRSLIQKAAWDLVGVFEPLCKSKDASGTEFLYPELEQLRQDISDLLTSKQILSLSLRDARRALFRLVNFPSKQTLRDFSGIALEHGLDEWTEPLITQTRQSPLLHPLRWLKGFACPWKAGWAMSTAGYPGAVFWIVCNKTLSILGPKFLTNVRCLINKES